jgi:low temperature requirement protein LtrA
VSEHVIGARGVLRSGRDDTRPQVGSIELFFDLVYVFAIIQLSHLLLRDVSWGGAAETAVLFLAVWWGWNYTAWAMNWLDPEHTLVRALLVVLMLAALVMAIAIPEAFGDRVVMFAGAYVFFQLLRSAFMVFAFRGQAMGRNYAQLLTWSAAAGSLWLVGAFGPEDSRLTIWALALLVDFAAPMVGFWLPMVGATKMSDWPLAESHLAERNRLVFIIALGESILILGFTLSEVDLTKPVVSAALVGFLTIVLLWWLYFGYRLGNVEHEAPDMSRATAMARSAYAYAHALMVGSAIVVAVGIEQVTLHPSDEATWAVATTVLGGPALYLLGNVIFNRARTGAVPRSRLVALAALAVLVPFAPAMTAVALAAASMVMLAALAVVTGEVRGPSSG